MAKEIIKDNVWLEACGIETKLHAMAQGMEMIREACIFEYANPQQGKTAQEHILFLTNAVEDLLQKAQERHSAVTSYLQQF